MSSAQLERRVQDLEERFGTGDAESSIDCILLIGVPPGGASATSAIVHGETVLRAADENETLFLARVADRARALRPPREVVSLVGVTCEA